MQSDARRLLKVESFPVLTGQMLIKVCVPLCRMYDITTSLRVRFRVR